MCQYLFMFTEHLTEKPANFTICEVFMHGNDNVLEIKGQLVQVLGVHVLLKITLVSIDQKIHVILATFRP